MIELTVDGIEVTVEQGATILEAAEKAGVKIPTLCHDKRIIPYGACRMCVVELEGRPGRLIPACFNPARNGSQVLTNTPAVIEARKLQLQFLLRHHPLDCPVCEAGGACELQNLVYEYQLDDLPFTREDPPFEVDSRSHFIKRDMNRCILCGRCVRICSEVQGVNEISFVNRGIRSEISPDFGRPLDCEFCGQCVSSCPVGALVNKPLGPIARPWEVTRTVTICGFCGLGCALVMEAKGDRVTQASSQYDVGGNQGNLCAKGRYGWPYLYSEQRLFRPLVRKGERLEEVSWDEAIHHVAEHWSSIRKDAGSQSLAVLGSTRLTNEEAYGLQRLTRGVIGTANLDHGGGLSYRALLEGLRPILGYAGATNAITDIFESDVILAVSGDFKQTHPVAKNQIVLAAGRRGAKVIVVDHVRSSLCDLIGSEGLMVQPGTEGLLIRGMIRYILDEGLWDQDFVEKRTEGVEDIRRSVQPHRLKSVAKKTGVSEEKIQEAAREFAQAGSGCIVMSLETLSTGDPVDLAQAVACLALLAGKIGRKGCGLHLYGEKANSQGALDMGLTPGFLPGYAPIDDYEARAVYEDLWKTELPEKEGLGARGILEASYRGALRSLYVVGENPIGTYPDSAWVEQALDKIEFLVVQDPFLSKTAERAQVVLPVASFAEKEGTYTSVDRRIQRVQKAVPSAKDAPTDLEVFGRLAEALGAPFDYSGPSEVLEEIGRALKLYAGVQRAVLTGGGLAWPLTDSEDGAGTPVLYSDHFPYGKARLWLSDWRAPKAEGGAKEYPMVLHPQASWFHSGTFSTWSPTLMEVFPAPRAILHRQDAESLNLKDGDRARVTSPRGSLEAAVVTRSRGLQGLVQVHHHFPTQPVNRLIGWDDGLVRVRVEKV